MTAKTSENVRMRDGLAFYWSADCMCHHNEGETAVNSQRARLKHRPLWSKKQPGHTTRSPAYRLH